MPPLRHDQFSKMHLPLGQGAARLEDRIRMGPLAAIDTDMLAGCAALEKYAERTTQIKRVNH
jgi:hypothetical protein